MAAKTNSQKQADRRGRLSCGGLFKRRDFWCHPDDESKLRALEKQLQDERKKMHNKSGEITSSVANVRCNDWLAACPCGCTPSSLRLVYNGQGVKWAEATGDCCGEWAVEFRTGYHELDTAACYALAIAAWNSAPRAADAE